jgi:hypothetical protein
LSSILKLLSTNLPNNTRHLQSPKKKKKSEKFTGTRTTKIVHQKKFTILVQNYLNENHFCKVNKTLLLDEQKSKHCHFYEITNARTKQLSQEKKNTNPNHVHLIILTQGLLSVTTTKRKTHTAL